MTWFSPIKPRANNLFSERVVRVFCYSVDHTIGTLWLVMFALSLFPKGKDFKHLFDTPPYPTWSTAAALAVVLSALFYWTGLFTCNPPDPEAFLGPRRPHDFERLGIVEGSPDPPGWQQMQRRSIPASNTYPATANTSPTTANTRPTTASTRPKTANTRPTTANTSPATANTAPTTNSDPDAIELVELNVPKQPRANASSRAIVYD
ncbi:MAG: hypothetical protein Q9167_002145 [Letrouitia subvulpina]